MCFEGKPRQTPNGLPAQEKLGCGEIHPFHTAPPLGLQRPLSPGINQEQYEETGWQVNVN